MDMMESSGIAKLMTLHLEGDKMFITYVNLMMAPEKSQGIVTCDGFYPAGILNISLYCSITIWTKVVRRQYFHLHWPMLHCSICDRFNLFCP